MSALLSDLKIGDKIQINDNDVLVVISAPVKIDDSWNVKCTSQDGSPHTLVGFDWTLV